MIIKYKALENGNFSLIETGQMTTLLEVINYSEGLNTFD